MKTGQVFVSHTSDMARFPAGRSFVQAALDAVGRAGMAPVDMRHFAARDGEPADYCRARVRECEIYVALIGFRYGSLVPDEAVSYTELEFQAATGAGLPRLVFLLDEAADLPAGQADANRCPVDGFRQRLRDAGLVVRDSTSDIGLELEVFHALSELTGGRLPAVPGQLPTAVPHLAGSPARFTALDDQVASQFSDCRDEIVVYLKTLIDWVSTDPWPRDRRFGGPVLTPAAIERRLRVSAPGRAGDEDLDADDLAQQCRRLVILGGPGSGKTWLAKRTARRCAEDALQALAAGADLDEVELPLYTTCSRLFSASGDIREAAVSSALAQLGDLGGSRPSVALRAFFAERNAPTVLVIDSLDEAHGSQERLRQADTLPWRIVLTTRPSSWNQQLAINDADVSHRVGELQPLRYPADVEPFIRRWFGHQPERGEDLVTQIARRPGLQQASTVPLVLAFYCIVGGREPLPDFRRDLYTRVLNRMLTGRWRGDDDRQPNVGACLQTLRVWARPGAEACHPVSGIGTWADDILTERAGLGGAGLGGADQGALDHVATPLGPADVDTGQTLRRFIHRSIREHLVAEFVARLPVDQAVQVLLPHLWHDSDWEYSAPAAIAMHPQHDQLLRDLIYRAANSDLLPGDLSVIDAGWEFRGLLARIATESSETDWSPGIAGMISRARVELAVSGRIDALGGAGLWVSSNGLTREALLRLLADPANSWAAEKLVSGVVQLATTAQDKRQTRAALLGLLPGLGDGWVADEIVIGVSRLGPTAHDRRRARDALLGLVPSQAGGWEAAWLVGRAVRLATTAQDKRQTRAALLGLLPGQAGGWVADEIAACVSRLGRTARDTGQARDAPARLPPRPAGAPLADEPAGWVSWRAPAADDNHQIRGMLLRSLASQTNGRKAAGLAAAVLYARPTAEEKRQAREVLLGLLASETDGRTAAELANIVSRLGPAEDNRQTCDTLLRLLTAQSHGHAAAWLADGVIQAGPTADDQRQARGALLRLLAGQTDGHKAARLASRVSRLDLTAEDKRRAPHALLALLAGQTDGQVALELARRVTRLDPTAEDKRQARHALLALLAGQTDGQVALELARRVTRLDPTAEDQRRTRDSLLRLLGHTDGPTAAGLVSWAVQLAATAEDQPQTSDALLRLLADHADGPLVSVLLGGLLRLATTAEGQRQTCNALLGLLSAGHAGACETAELVAAVVSLAATARDKRHALGALLGLLAGQADGWVASELVLGVVQLSPTAQDKRQARHALLALLAGQASGPLAARLVDSLVRLDPTASDISTWRAWEVPPTTKLLAAVRRNSELSAWLAALPALAPLSSPLVPLQNSARRWSA